MADKIVHFDITGPDLTPLSKFYTELFGWSIGDRNEGYAQVRTGGGLQGGIVESESTGINVGIQVDDLQHALDQAKALGGTVVMPVTDNGWVVKAQVQDPAGNLLSLIQADKDPKANS